MVIHGPCANMERSVVVQIANSAILPISALIQSAHLRSANFGMCPDPRNRRLPKSRVVMGLLAPTGLLVSSTTRRNLRRKRQRSPRKQSRDQSHLRRLGQLCVNEEIRVLFSRKEHALSVTLQTRCVFLPGTVNTFPPKIQRRANLVLKVTPLANERILSF